MRRYPGWRLSILFNEILRTVEGTLMVNSRDEKLSILFNEILRNHF